MLIPATRRRVVYLLLSMVTMLAGLASRHWRRQLPAWVGLYAGDALWALLVYWLLSVLWPRGPLGHRAAAALGCAALIEISQLWQVPWLNALRATTLGALVLGRGFLWSDLGCYVVGVGVGVLLEWWVRPRNQAASFQKP